MKSASFFITTFIVLSILAAPAIQVKKEE